MNYFEPNMIAGDRLREMYSISFSQQQREMFKLLAEYIYRDAITKLSIAVKNGINDMIEIDLSLDYISTLYTFDKSLYNEIGVKREIINLAEREKTKVYPSMANKIIITF